MADVLLTHRESFERRNVRFLGYNFLKDVRYEGEPVVPAIISETVDTNDPHTNVEVLGGVDLGKFLDDINIGMREKLDVLQHIVGQLRVVDEAGIVLFDRSGENVRVLSSGEHNSIRQIDLAEFYDKKSEALYVESRETYLVPQVEMHELFGRNMWSESVTRLMRDFIHHAGKSSGIDLRPRLGKYMDYEWNELPKRDVLVELEVDVSQATGEFNAKKINLI